MATKKDRTTIFCFTLLFCCCFWIRDLRSGIRDGQKSGSGINIPDPQYWPVPLPVLTASSRCEHESRSNTLRQCRGDPQPAAHGGLWGLRALLQRGVNHPCCAHGNRYDEKCQLWWIDDLPLWTDLNVFRGLFISSAPTTSADFSLLFLRFFYPPQKIVV